MFSIPLSLYLYPYIFHIYAYVFIYPYVILDLLVFSHLLESGGREFTPQHIIAFMIFTCYYDLLWIWNFSRSFPNPSDASGPSPARAAAALVVLAKAFNAAACVS